MLIKRTFPSQALLGCRKPSRLNPRHISRGSGDPVTGANRRRMPRSAISFGASPSANPVSDRKSRCTKEPPVNGWKPNTAGPSGRATGRRAKERPLRRPDLIAFWAVVMAVIAMVAAATSAHAGSGGTASSVERAARAAARPRSSAPERSTSGIAEATSRRSTGCSRRIPTACPSEKDFDDPTQGSVRRFQRRHSLHANGVVGAGTRKKITRTMPKSVATGTGPASSATAPRAVRGWAERRSASPIASCPVGPG